MRSARDMLHNYVSSISTSWRNKYISHYYIILNSDKRHNRGYLCKDLSKQTTTKNKNTKVLRIYSAILIRFRHKSLFLTFRKFSRYINGNNGENN